MKRMAHELWKNYLFLTQELVKFLEKKDFEMVENLIDQRETLQEIIEKAADYEFSSSVEGQGILKQIFALDQQVVKKMKFLYNANKRQHEVSQNYDGYGLQAPAGRRMNIQT